MIVSKIFALPHVSSERTSRRKDGTASRPSRSNKLECTIDTTITTVQNGIYVGTSVQTICWDEVIIAAKLVRFANKTATTISFSVDDFVTANGTSWFVATEIHTDTSYKYSTVDAIAGTIINVGAGVDAKKVFSCGTTDGWATIFISNARIATRAVVN